MLEACACGCATVPAPRTPADFAVRGALKGGHAADSEVFLQLQTVAHLPMPGTRHQLVCHPPSARLDSAVPVLQRSGWSRRRGGAGIERDRAVLGSEPGGREPGGGGRRRCLDPPPQALLAPGGRLQLLLHGPEPGLRAFQRVAQLALALGRLPHELAVRLLELPARLLGRGRLVRELRDHALRGAAVGTGVDAGQAGLGPLRAPGRGLGGLHLPPLALPGLPGRALHLLGVGLAQLLPDLVRGLLDESHAVGGRLGAALPQLRLRGPGPVEGRLGPLPLVVVAVAAAGPLPLRGGGLLGPLPVRPLQFLAVPPAALRGRSPPGEARPEGGRLAAGAGRRGATPGWRGAARGRLGGRVAAAGAVPQHVRGVGAALPPGGPLAAVRAPVLPRRRLHEDAAGQGPGCRPPPRARSMASLVARQAHG
mmetsp:Transcript_11482/g.36020  ORF Transcript_11482/g.36020 Transcript_11482/m.36020 type:complete len:424 (-) Transcript_11482:17-1288(-)